MRSQNGVLRAFVIDGLGPCAKDRDWNVEAATSDILNSLALTYEQAQAPALGMARAPAATDLIRQLRDIKNITAPLALLTPQLPAGHVRDLDRKWLALRGHLP